ncbi:hypothetical protein [Sphingomonas sp. VNH70]|uniref:hypothetical protein n=1 Tax=Sphingomonas silueang TaxID=3156617 RepID=UPI0032B56317
MAGTRSAARHGLPLAPVVAGAAGLAIALAVALIPAWRVEAAVAASGLSGLIPAAAPPLGVTARLGLMLGFGGMVTVLLWGALVLLFPGAVIGRRVRRTRPAADDPRLLAPAGPEPPVVRRADAHPDAPPRPPMRATRDLGAPFLAGAEPVTGTVDSGIELPRDLDTPLALFDPLALPSVPAAPHATVKPLFRKAAPPAADPPPAPPAARDAPPLSVLLARLDAGLAKRGAVERQDAPPPPPSAPRLPAGLAATLGQLRRMATRD